jgi:hypothetical protein
MQPNDVFCGNCGQAQVRQAAPQAPVQKSSGGGALIGVMAVGAIGLLVCCGGVGYFFYGPSGYTPSPRVQPQIPPRLAGTMSVLPMDNVGPSGVHPTSITTQRFDGVRPPGQSPPTVNVPPEKLPPGLDPQQIPQWAGGMTTVTYRGGAGTTPGRTVTTSDPGPESVNVHILDTAGRSSGPAITTSIAQATGGQQDPIQVQSPTGASFTGTRIQAPQSVIYVLINPTGDLVIVVYGPNEVSRPAADRLASNLGNGQGALDPELTPYICVLPAAPPFGLQIRDLQTYGTEELTAAGNAMQTTLNQPGVQGGAELASQLQQIMPQMLVITTYEDTQGREWGSLVCDYGNPRKAWFLWFIIESLMRAMEGSVTVSVQGCQGISATDAEVQVLLFFKGPYIVMLMGPAGEPVERLVELGVSLQL